MAQASDTHCAPWETDTDVSDLTLVELAERLQTVTTWIEAERVKEREARAAYQVVADEVNQRILEIRGFARHLVEEQNRRLTSFNGLLDRRPADLSSNHSESNHAPANSRRKNISQAILDIWSLDRYAEPLSTEQITRALHDVGYKTRAAPRSLKSAVNQALAKLCRDGHVTKYRLDGTIVDPQDRHARARRYMAAQPVHTEV